MSKVLRRPLFRGGPVDPRGTGITSGLDDGRVRKKVGGDFTYYDTLGINQPYLVSQKPYLVPNMQGGKGYLVSRGPVYEGPSSMADMSLSELLQSQLAEKGDVFYRPENEIENLNVGAPELTEDELYNYRYKQQKVKDTQEKVKDSYDKNSREARDNNLYASRNDTAMDATYPNDIYDIEGVAGDSPGLGSAGKNSVTGFKDYTDFIKSIAEEKLQKREKGNMIKPPNETEISQEDIIDSIFKERVAKAKRGDIADVLGGAAEGFLTGGLREGLVGATRASRTPGRAEQLENTLASLKVQDKLGQAKEERTQKFELEKLEKALKGQEKIAALKGPALSDYGKKRNELTAQGFDSNTADRIARGGYANLDELMIAKPDLPLRQFETAVRYIYGENSVKGKLTEEELKDQTLLNNLDPGIYIVDKQRTIVDTRSGKVNTIRY